MTSFRSNLNSVSNTYGFTALKNQITTCFNHWRRKSVQTTEQIFSEIKSNCNFQQKRGLSFKWNCKEYHNLQKTNANLRNLNAKLKEILSRNLNFPEKIKNRNSESKKVEIVAKLLSSTLIAAPSPNKLNCFGNTTSISIIKTAVVEVPGNAMTIAEDPFLLIRQEYPDLDLEIRSILTSRAQTGATIAEIRDDYRKNTGMIFPIYENVTDFLLCIPGVMAFCSENGTRIFNVKPTEKTKHIHNLIANQKAPSERRSRTGYSNNRQTFRRDSGYNSFRSETVPLSWRVNYNHNYQPPEFRVFNTTIMRENFPNQQQQQQRQNLVQIPLNNIEEGSFQVDSNDFGDDRNGYYQDNCQHLFNRIYTNYQIMDNGNSSNIHENFDNRSETATQTSTQNLEYQPDLPNHNTRDIHVFKRPIGQAVRKPATHSSSISGANPASNSISTISSDFNYEAHLLDFPLVGDDFFLYLARMELKCKFKKYEKVLQSGLCVSGQTIKAATKRIGRLPFNAFANKIIVNIGSVDIMQGKTLVQIEHDFRKLILVINRRGLLPIITTLAPLANYGHDSAVKTKLERFNEFIKRECENFLVIDIWPRFVNERRQTLFDCYQSEPRQVTGANESYVFWNKIGRQRVLQIIETELEY